MAVSAVYVRLAPVLTNMSYGDSPPAFANISSTTAAFPITVGGLYRATCIGTSFGTVALSQMGPDDSTYVPVNIQVGTATVSSGTVEGTLAAFTANATGLVYLSPGMYKWTLG
jgi:predicted histidine transporter YuiF (NhaC family)